jgi:hypothetical protein
LHGVAAPNIPVDPHVCCVEVVGHCVELGEHSTQPPLRHAGVAPPQAVDPCQLPVAPQVCGVSRPAPLHCVCPGPHTPMQAPLTQVRLAAHGAPVPNAPARPHVWTPLLPSHCVCVGPHVPPHAPLMHVRLTAHATPAPNWPLEPHVWTPLSLSHCVWPWPHVPPHTPLMHVRFVGHGTPVPNVPSDPHV